MALEGTNKRFITLGSLNGGKSLFRNSPLKKGLEWHVVTGWMKNKEKEHSRKSV